MNKVEKLFLYITSSLFFLSIFIMGFSSVCHAEGNISLPYNVPNNSSMNSIMLRDDLIDIVKNAYYTEFNLSSDTPLLIFTDYGFDGTYYHYVVMCSPTCENGIGENYNITQASVTFYSTQYCRAYHIKDNGSIEGVSWLGLNMQLFGTVNEIQSAIGPYVPNYPFYYNGDDIYSLGIDSSNKTLIITNTIPYSPDVPTVGHATQPTNDPNNFINGSNGQPVTRPTSPTINNYTWNTWTCPTVDTSTVESLLESLIDVVSSLFSWLGSNISGEFQNLVSNLQNLFDFLVQGIENGFNKVISSIQGLGTDLYNNFVSLFESITQQLFYISSPVDTELIQGEVESTSLMSDYSQVVSIKDSFVSVFTDTSEPSTFTIPIHLENLSMLNVGTQYIDLSVINPVKSALRTFIWVIVSFGLVVTIIDSIPNYINGGGDE